MGRTGSLVTPQIAYGNAAGGYNGISRTCGSQHGIFNCLAVVSDYTKVNNVDTQPGQHAVQGITITVIDLADFQRFTGRA